ncbi:MAG: hypothetical protein J5527_03000 [Treponema sp.]|nr:hypothetical protein [Treponema sp.]
MRIRYEFKKKVFAFANEEENGYDSIKCLGLYNKYEVYMPYCKWWKKNPPVIGLPQLILINEKETRWTNGTECFKVMDECKKIPTRIFEYRCAAFFGISFDVILFADGTLIKYDYGSAETRYVEKYVIEPAEILLCNKELSKKVNQIIKDNYSKIKDIPKSIYDPFILDGAEEKICFGKKTFLGWNILLGKYTKKQIENDEYCEAWRDLLNNLIVVQDVFKKVRQIINSYWKGCI